MTTENTTTGEWSTTPREEVLTFIEGMLAAAAKGGVATLDVAADAVSILEEIEGRVTGLAFADFHDKGLHFPGLNVELLFESPDPTEAEIGADLERRGGTGFITMTKDDERHIRGE